MAKYRHIRRIATGGMGTVELVVREEREFRRVYAMKRLRPELRGQPDVEAMFRSEAKIAGLLHHPNVVSVIDVGEDEEGPYLVMDFVRGLSLSRLLEHLGQAGERIPQGVALSIFLDVANGLQAAHELRDLHGRPLGLVHRDVSPQNVLIGFDGVARLADFGIAKAAAHGDRTTTGLLKGKVGYFAPEQLRFESPTPQTDLYAFGVALFECLAGRRFYSSKVAEEIERSVLHDPPPDLYEERRDAHPALVELLFRLLAKSPSKRPSSAASVATALRDIAQDLGETEPTPTLREFLEGRFPQERARVEELLSSTHGHRPRR
ncbi:MAG: serine/threonine-protein kinase, partial [Myxococcota bacterium]